MHDEDAPLVAIGRIRRAVGLDGRLEIELYSGDIGRLAPGISVLIDGKRFVVEKSFSGRKGLFSLHIEKVTDRDSADQFRGMEIEVPEIEVPPAPEGTYYHYQLIGSTVVDESGSRIGTLSGIMETGANDVYVVEQYDGREMLVPATKDTVVRVDTLKKIVTVELPAGVTDPSPDSDAHE